MLGVRSPSRSIAISVLGGLLGGMAGAATAVLATELIKRILAVVSIGRTSGWLIVVPLVGVG